ncbi:hypothetical protein [Aliarcobacter trophiarum]|nr:hypothetical protein [Aliarcobacter trophiarum]
MTNFTTIPLIFVAKELNVSRQILIYYVKSNFKLEVDFYIKDNKTL